MKKRMKIVALAAVGTLCAAIGVTQMQTTASAEGSVLQSYQEYVTMAKGASVRYIGDLDAETETTVSDDNGLRFEMQITPEAYRALQGAYEAVTFGILIAPASYEDDVCELTVESVFGDETTKKYDWAIWNAENGNYEYEQSEYTRIINVSTTVDFNTSDLKATYEDGEIAYYRYYGSVTGIRQGNLSREFVGVGYVTAGEETVLAKRNENERSMTYVAQKALEDEKSDLSDSAKTWIEKNYVQSVEREETTYTVQYRIGTNVKEGKAVIATQEVGGVRIGEALENTVFELEGYTNFALSESESDSIAYANGKSVLVVDCEYADSVKVELQGNDAQAYAYAKDVIFYLTEDASTDYDGISGIFYNATDAEMTISVGSGYGAAAIVDKNGLVVEGRDGANGKLVNAENPVRSTSTAKLDATKFAENMTIPAGGFAIVVQQSSSYLTYVNETNDAIRDFMYKNIIGRYGNCVQISVIGTNKTFTEYKNAAPTITEASSLRITVKYNGTIGNARLLDGITATDDNGTFTTADDTDEKITLAVVSSDVDLKAAGKYEAVISATDADGATATFTRSIEVIDEVTLTVGESSFSTTSGKIAVDTQAQSSAQFFAVQFRLYTPAYNKDATSLHCSNGYGAALIIDKKGNVVKAYDAGGAYYTDNQGTSAGSVSMGNMDAVYTDWYNNYRSDGAYLLIAPNDGVNASDGARQFLRDLVSTTCGQTVVLSYYDF